MKFLQLVIPVNCFRPYTKYGSCVSKRMKQDGTIFRGMRNLRRDFGNFVFPVFDSLLVLKAVAQITARLRKQQFFYINKKFYWLSKFSYAKSLKWLISCIN